MPVRISSLLFLVNDSRKKLNPALDLAAYLARACKLVAMTELPSSLAAIPCAVCKVFDYLPLECIHCRFIHCSSHANPARHSCTKFPLTRAEEGGRFNDKFNDLLPARGEGEKEGRNREAAAKQGRREEIQKVLESNFGRSMRGESGPTVKKKVNSTIELMRLKQRAIAGNPTKTAGNIAMVDRIYLVIKLVDKTKRDEEVIEIREVWLPKVSAGER
jgi:hypothetical protein